jgi:hypothetical protein
MAVGTILATPLGHAPVPFAIAAPGGSEPTADEAITIDSLYRFCVAQYHSNRTCLRAQHETR